jgi:hypothetical protein
MLSLLQLYDVEMMSTTKSRTIPQVPFSRAPRFRPTFSPHLA